MNLIHFTIFSWMRHTSCEWKNVRLWEVEQLSVCLTWLVSTKSKYLAHLLYLAAYNKRKRVCCDHYQYFFFPEHYFTVAYWCDYNVNFIYSSKGLTNAQNYAKLLSIIIKPILTLADLLWSCAVFIASSCVRFCLTDMQSLSWCTGGLGIPSLTH